MVRRYVLMGLTGLMLSSLVPIAEAPNLAVLMVALALLGIIIGGFWSLATATVMRLVPEDSVQKALGVLSTGNAVVTAFAAPIGSYLGGLISWRGVFWALVPITAVNLFWQWISLPTMPPQAANSVCVGSDVDVRRRVCNVCARRPRCKGNIAALQQTKQLAECGTYRMRAFNDGRFLETELKLVESGKGMTWGFELGQIKTSSVMRITEKGD